MEASTFKACVMLFYMFLFTPVDPQIDKYLYLFLSKLLEITISGVYITAIVV